MPIVHLVDAASATVCVTVTGAVSPTQVAAVTEAVRNDPQASDCKRLLVDCRAATIVLTSSEVRGLALTYAQQGIDPTVRIAVVVSSDVAAGLARMFAGYAWLSADTFTVFRNIGTAREWLRPHAARVV